MPVYMTTATEGATIFYTQGSTCPNDPTRDGATPTGTTLIYNPASPPTLGVGQAALFSALGYKTGLADSVITACINEDNVQNGPETGPERSVSYTWDKAGNRSNVTEVPMIGSVSYTTNNLNQYKYVGAKTVSNGTAHEITSYDSVSYAYMGDTYLAQATASPNIYTLYYDALGRCIKRVRSNMGVETINYYLFDGEHWILEYNSTGTAVQSSLLYGNGLDEIVARFNGSAPVGSQLQWPYPDRNNNTSVVTGSGGAILESYRYDAFGAPTIYNPSDTVIPATAIANRFLFTGREWNPELKFYEYRARAYNPALGRFMSEDPKGFDASDYNLYRYVANDPLDRVDPMGLDPGDPFQSAVDAGADAARFINPTSIRQNREYGGFIYKDSASGQYFATTPLKAGATGTQGVHVQLPKGSEVAGNYHTHGDYSKPDPRTGKPVRTTKDQDAYDSDQFSKSDIKNFKAEGAGKREFTSILDTPSGRIWRLDATKPQATPAPVPTPPVPSTIKKTGP